MELLVPLFAALIFGTALLERSEGDDDAPEAPPAGPTEGADVLTVRTDAAGTYDGLGGNDTITAVSSNDAVLTFDPLFLSGEFFGDAQPLTVFGGDGDDDISVSGNGLRVDGGNGTDVIRLNGVTNATIFGETVYGQAAMPGEDPGDVPDVLIYINGQNGTGQFFGGTSDEVVSGGSDVNGGAGNDSLYSGEFAAHLKGDDGDDVLDGNRAREFRSFSELPMFLATDVDTLDGGVGDDTISGSHGDIMTGGAGADSFVAYTDTQHWDRLSVEQPDAVMVTDFDPAEDRMVILFDEISGADDGPGPTLAGRITTEVDADGNLLVIGDGETLAVIAGGANATVVIQIGQDSSSGTTSIVYGNLDGTPASAADADIIIQSFRGVG
jgi:Ca2+-binding RTX toxin-like protein